ncbi:MFS transporter [Fundicoccus culcitae]|uniref:MFS transporter n=1 Tax=Fundicoccus culcitae TaxID=2969821 RepID=A0ABY5PA49_9LACT|nr:MFS transporter [Fundicoccus culcitae]UUX35429.1 MFS transporter [Fundicoccus culcitae]
MSMKKISILSLSTVTGAATAITTIIPLMVIAFPNQSQAAVESLVTIASLSALVTIVFNDCFTRRLGVKKTILLGLIGAIIFGIMPYFLTDFYAILASRILLGLAIGLYSPHAISLISLSYSGQERTTLLGMQMGISGLGNAIFLFAAGILAAITWQTTFFVYLLIACVALLVFRFVPEVDLPIARKNTPSTPINIPVLTYSLLCFITFLIFWGVQLKLPSLLVEKGIVASEASGLILGTMNIAGMLAGFAFGSCYRKVQTLLLPIGFIGAAVFIFSMVYLDGFVSLLIVVNCYNFIFSFTGPTIVLKVNQHALDHQLTQANSMVTTATILSSFVAPFVWNPISEWVGAGDQASLTLMIVGFSALWVGLVLLAIYRPRSARR